MNRNTSVLFGGDKVRSESSVTSHRHEVTIDYVRVIGDSGT